MDFGAFVRSYDYFGAPVGIKLQGYGKAYSTNISGVISIALKILLFWLVITKLLVIAEGDSTLIGFTNKYIDPSVTNEVSLEDAGFLVYLQGMSPENEELAINPTDMVQYVTVYGQYAWRDKDATEDAPGNHGYKKIEIRVCKEEDFRAVNGMHIWKTLTAKHANSLLCLDNYKDIKLNATGMNPKDTKGLKLYFYHCHDTQPGCTSKSNRENFWQNNYLLIYYLSQQFDSSVFNEKPLVAVEKLAGLAQFITGTPSLYLKLPIRWNTIKLKDSLVELGQAPTKYNYIDVDEVSQFNPQYQSELSFQLLIDMPLSDREIVHTRKVYGFIDLLGQFGGIRNICLLVIGLIFRQLNADMALIWQLKKFFRFQVDGPSGKMDYSIQEESDYSILWKIYCPCCSKDKKSRLIQEIAKKQEETLKHEQELGRILGSLRKLDTMLNDRSLKVINQEQAEQLAGLQVKTIIVSEYENVMVNDLPMKNVKNTNQVYQNDGGSVEVPINKGPEKLEDVENEWQ